MKDYGQEGILYPKTLAIAQQEIQRMINKYGNDTEVLFECKLLRGIKLAGHTGKKTK